MTSSLRANTLGWLALLALAGGTLLANGRGHGTGAAALLLLAAAKSAVVGWQYMELRSAHGLWRFGFVVLLAGLLGALVLLAGH